MRLVFGLLLLACLSVAASAQDQEPPAAVVAWEVEPGAKSKYSFELPASVDVSGCDRVELSIHPAEAYDLIGVRFDEADRKASWFREDRAPPGTWTTLSLPLRWFRASRGAMPRWEGVRRITISSEGRLKVRSVRLIAGDGPGAAYPDAADLRALAFPSKRPGLERSGRVQVRGRFALLTDDPELRMGDVLGELGRMETRLLSEFPPVHEPDRRAVLLVFRSFEAYDAFWVRYLLRCGFERPPLAGRSGFSMAGFAATWRHEEETGSRPRYVHEAVHPLLAIRHGIANDGSWVQEGIAEREAWRSAGGGPPMATIHAGVADESGTERKTLAGMLDPYPARFGYWQAALYVEWMLADPGRRAGFIRYVADSRKRCDEPRLQLFETAMGAKAPAIDKRWLRDMRKRYGSDDD